MKKEFRPHIYISGQWFSVGFKYPKNIRKLLANKPLEFYEKASVWVDGENTECEVCVRFSKMFHSEDRFKRTDYEDPDYILVEGFVKKINKENKINWWQLYSQNTPIRINENWEISYWFNKTTETLEFSGIDFENNPEYVIVEKKASNEEYDWIYRCEKFLNPKLAKETYKNIRKNDLCTKPIFDSFMRDYDWRCNACKANSWVGNPDIGYVVEKNYNNFTHKPIEAVLKENGLFAYKGKYYKPCSEDIYDRLIFYNKDEYQEKVLDFYEPKHLTWLNEQEYNTKAQRMSIKSFNELGFEGEWKPKFKEFAEKVGSCVRLLSDPNNKGFKFSKNRVYAWTDEYLKPDMETEEVVTFDNIEFEKRYKPFDELWKVELTQKEIDDNGNSIGGAWRDLETKKVIGRETDELLDESKYEKVVTLSWHSTKKPEGAVECPVCRDLYLSLCRSGYTPLNRFQRFWERLNYTDFVSKIILKRRQKKMQEWCRKQEEKNIEEYYANKDNK